MRVATKNRIMKQILVQIALAIFSLLMSIFPAKGQDNNSLLWKIEGEQLEKPSYLFGTIHLLCSEDLNMSEKIKNALNESDQLILELDLDDPNVLGEVQRKMMFTDGTTASDYLDEEEYEMVSNFFSDSLRIPFERLKSVKPFFLASMTYSHFLGCQPTGFEMALMNLVKPQGKEVLGLETAEEQMGIITNLPMETRKTMLVETISEYEKSKKMIDDMIAHYVNENILELHKLSEEYMSDDYAELNNKLLVERNQNWIKDIENHATEKPTFFAVGAAHLGGDKGVIKLLKDKGYKVTPVK